MRDLRWAGRHTHALRLLGSPTAALGLAAMLPCAGAQTLPEAPSALLTRSTAPGVIESANALGEVGSESLSPKDLEQQNAVSSSPQGGLPPCGNGKPTGSPPAGAPVIGENKSNMPCREDNPLQPIVASKRLPALSSRQKGHLAVRDVIDPFNLLTITANAGVIVGANAHTAYGPGFPGFGRLIGYSLVEDMQGEFFGTYVIPSLAHQDPRYYRMPGRPFRRRLLNAIEHTVVTRHDDGSPMPNYATLLTYPISAELTNLYVPGVAVDAPSTAKRVGLGLATDPIGQLVAEFLPDVARRIHIRVIFVQQILQNVAGTGAGGAVATQ